MLLVLFSFCFSFARTRPIAIEEPENSIIYTSNDEGSKYYRIPAIVRAGDGSLVIATDKRWDSADDLPANIDVVIKRSTDNGKTWSTSTTIAGQGTTLGYGDASLVVDRKRNNTILCLFNGERGFMQSTASNPQRLFVSKSFDNGITWTEKVDITNQIYGSKCTNSERKSWEGMFMASGNALQLRSGRIMTVGLVRKPWHWIARYCYALYSDDGGDTWDVAIKCASDIGDEAKVIEKDNGDVIMSVRHKGKRLFAISSDKGLTWGNFWPQNEIIEPGCNGDLILFSSTKEGDDKSRWLHSVPYNSNTRKNVTVLLSYDEGLTWPIMKTIYAENSGYSSLAKTAEGKIAVYYERDCYNGKTWVGYNMTLTTFTLEWLTDGKDSYKPRMKAMNEKK